jgi:hypothetical protein
VQKIIARLTERTRSESAMDLFFGNGIASEYFKVATEDNMDNTDINRANIPKSLGEYNLVSIGSDINEIAFANTLPTARAAIPLNTSFPGP